VCPASSAMTSGSRACLGSALSRGHEVDRGLPFGLRHLADGVDERAPGDQHSEIFLRHLASPACTARNTPPGRRPGPPAACSSIQRISPAMGMFSAVRLEQNPPVAGGQQCLRELRENGRNQTAGSRRPGSSGSGPSSARRSSSSGFRGCAGHPDHGLAPQAPDATLRREPPVKCVYQVAGRRGRRGGLDPLESLPIREGRPARPGSTSAAWSDRR